MCRCCGLDPYENQTVEAIAALAHDTLRNSGRLYSECRPYRELPEEIKAEYDEMVAFVLDTPNPRPQELYELGEASAETPFFMLSDYQQDTYKILTAVIKAALSGMGAL